MESWNKSNKEGNNFLSTHEAESLRDDDDPVFLEPLLVLFSTLHCTGHSPLGHFRRETILKTLFKLEQLNSDQLS